jgi:hypothetical protein
MALPMSPRLAHQPPGVGPPCLRGRPPYLGVLIGGPPYLVVGRSGGGPPYLGTGGGGSAKAPASGDAPPSAVAGSLPSAPSSSAGGSSSEGSPSEGSDVSRSTGGGPPYLTGWGSGPGGGPPYFTAGLQAATRVESAPVVTAQSAAATERAPPRKPRRGLGRSVIGLHRRWAAAQGLRQRWYHGANHLGLRRQASL